MQIGQTQRLGLLSMGKAGAVSSRAGVVGVGDAIKEYVERAGVTNVHKLD